MQFVTGLKFKKKLYDQNQAKEMLNGVHRKSKIDIQYKNQVIALVLCQEGHLAFKSPAAAAVKDFSNRS